MSVKKSLTPIPVIVYEPVILVIRGDELPKKNFGIKLHPTYETSIYIKSNGVKQLTTPHRVIKFYDQYKDFCEALGKLGIGENMQINITTPFPPTYTKSQFGGVLTEQELQHRCYLLSRWMAAIFHRFPDFPSNAQELVSEFLSLYDNDIAEEKNKEQILSLLKTQRDRQMTASVASTSTCPPNIGRNSSNLATSSEVINDKSVTLLSSKLQKQPSQDCTTVDQASKISIEILDSYGERRENMKRLQHVASLSVGEVWEYVQACSESKHPHYVSSFYYGVISRLREEFIMLNGTPMLIRRVYGDCSEVGEYSRVGLVLAGDIHKCMICSKSFGLARPKLHCYACGNVVCSRCSTGDIVMEEAAAMGPQHVCHQCYCGQEVVKTSPNDNLGLTNFVNLQKNHIVLKQSQMQPRFLLHMRRTSKGKALVFVNIGACEDIPLRRFMDSLLASTVVSSADGSLDANKGSGDRGNNVGAGGRSSVSRRWSSIDRRSELVYMVCAAPTTSAGVGGASVVTYSVGVNPAALAGRDYELGTKEGLDQVFQQVVNMIRRCYMEDALGEYEVDLDSVYRFPSNDAPAAFMQQHGHQQQQKGAQGLFVPRNSAFAGERVSFLVPSCSPPPATPATASSTAISMCGVHLYEREVQIALRKVDEIRFQDAQRRLQRGSRYGGSCGGGDAIGGGFDDDANDELTISSSISSLSRISEGKGVKVTTTYGTSQGSPSSSDRLRYVPAPMLEIRRLNSLKLSSRLLDLGSTGAGVVERVGMGAQEEVPPTFKLEASDQLEGVGRIKTQSFTVANEGRLALSPEMVAFQPSKHTVPEVEESVRVASVRDPAQLLGWQVLILRKDGSIIGLAVVTGLRKNSARQTEYRLSVPEEPDCWLRLRRSGKKTGADFRLLRRVISREEIVNLFSRPQKGWLNER